MTGVTGTGGVRDAPEVPLNLKGKRELDIHILADQSSIEVFAGQYQTNHSCNVFASSAQNGNWVSAEGGGQNLRVYEPGASGKFQFLPGHFGFDQVIFKMTWSKPK